MRSKVGFCSHALTAGPAVYEDAGHARHLARREQASAWETRCVPPAQAEEGQGVIVAVMAPSAALAQLLLCLVGFHELAIRQLMQRAVYPHLGHQEVLVVVLFVG